MNSSKRNEILRPVSKIRESTFDLFNLVMGAAMIPLVTNGMTRISALIAQEIYEKYHPSSNDSDQE